MKLHVTLTIALLVLAGCVTNTFPPRTVEREQRSAQMAAMQRRPTGPSMGPSWQRANKRISSVKIGAPKAPQRAKAPKARGTKR